MTKLKAKTKATDVELLRARAWQHLIAMAAELVDDLDEPGLRAMAHAIGIDLDLPTWDEIERN